MRGMTAFSCRFSMIFQYLYILQWLFADRLPVAVIEWQPSWGASLFYRASKSSVSLCPRKSLETLTTSNSMLCSHLVRQDANLALMPKLMRLMHTLFSENRNSHTHTQRETNTYIRRHRETTTYIRWHRDTVTYSHPRTPTQVYNLLLLYHLLAPFFTSPTDVQIGIQLIAYCSLAPIAVNLIGLAWSFNITVYPWRQTQSIDCLSVMLGGLLINWYCIGFIHSFVVLTWSGFICSLLYLLDDNN